MTAEFKITICTEHSRIASESTRRARSPLIALLPPLPPSLCRRHRPYLGTPIPEPLPFPLLISILQAISPSHHAGISPYTHRAYTSSSTLLRTSGCAPTTIAPVLARQNAPRGMPTPAFRRGVPFLSDMMPSTAVVALRRRRQCTLAAETWRATVSRHHSMGTKGTHRAVGREGGRRTWDGCRYRKGSVARARTPREKPSNTDNTRRPVRVRPSHPPFMTANDVSEPPDRTTKPQSPTGTPLSLSPRYSVLFHGHLAYGESQPRRTRQSWRRPWQAPR